MIKALIIGTSLLTLAGCGGFEHRKAVRESDKTCEEFKVGEVVANKYNNKEYLVVSTKAYRAGGLVRLAGRITVYDIEEDEKKHVSCPLVERVGESQNDML